jgi:hypothetical protein
MMLFQKTLLRRCIASLAIGFTGIILALAQSDEASILASLFEAGCENSCFLGFEPGITTLEEIELELQSQNIEYRFDAPMLYWYIKPQVGIVSGEASHLVMMTIIDGILIQTVFPIDTTIEAVVAVFGSPEIVSVEESGYTFAYPALGLAFIHNHLRGDPDQFSRIVNSAPYNTSSRTSHPSGKLVEQACPNYGTLPVSFRRQHPRLPQHP